MVLGDVAVSKVMREAAFPPDTPHALLARRYLAALLAADRRQASLMILGAVKDGLSVRDAYIDVLQPVQWELGRLWYLETISTAQEHLATATTQLVMSQLYPSIFNAERAGRTLVATCVEGELHELGVRMVSDFFEMAGWDAFYLGASTPMTDVVATVAERCADLVAISVTLSWHVPVAAALVRALRTDARTSSVPILVGGRPFMEAPDLWRAMGADASVAQADQAVAVGERLLRTRDRSAVRPELPAADWPMPSSAVAVHEHFDELTRLNNELATLQREGARKAAQLERLGKEKDRLLGVVSHDLRNPLSVIASYTDLLLSGGVGHLDHRQRKALESVARMSRFMFGLVEDLLDFSSFESGQVTLDRHLFDLAFEIADASEANQLLAAPKNIRIEPLCPERLLIHADQFKIRQVLNNLLSNAVNYSRPGSLIRVRAWQRHDTVQLTVTDQGPGIPKGELDRLFAPFGRTSVRGTAGEKSTGLGLAIVRRIVEAHGGHIRVQSKVGRGSRFVVSLPR